MIDAIWEGVHWVLGLDQEELAIWQMALRALIVYVVAVALVRLGEKRFMGRSTAFDVILGIILGSVISRAITGNAPFFPTLGAGFVLVVLHWLLAVLTFYSDGFGSVVKGHERPLIRGGEIQWDNMRKSHLSKKDLLEALRLNAKVTDPSEVEVAHFERNGEISAIPRRRDPLIVEVAVEAGVQTVRIELE